LQLVDCSDLTLPFVYSIFSLAQVIRGVVISGVDVDDPLAMVVGATELALVCALQVSLERAFATC
jgi:hypothetical protein